MNISHDQRGKLTDQLNVRGSSGENCQTVKRDPKMIVQNLGEVCEHIGLFGDVIFDLPLTS